MSYNDERLILAESVAQYVAFLESPLQHQKELQRLFPRTRNDMEASVAAFAYSYVSDANYPAADGVGAVARSYVANPKASDNTYSGNWRHVSTQFDPKRNGWFQVLRFGWAVSVLTAGAPNDECFLVDGNYPLASSDVRTLEWRNIDPASVQACVASLRTQATFVDPSIQGAALTAGTWNIGNVAPTQTEDGTYIIRATIARSFTLSQTVSDDVGNTVTRTDNQNVASSALTVEKAAGIARQGSVTPTGNGLWETSLTTDTCHAIIETGTILTAGGTRYWWRGRNVTLAQKDAAVTAAALTELTNNHVDIQKSARYQDRWDYYIVKSPNRIYLWEESIKTGRVKWERQDGHIWLSSESRNVKAYRYVKVTYNTKICHNEDDAEGFIDGGLDGSRVVGYGGMGYKAIKVTEINTDYSDATAPATKNWHQDETWAT